MGLQYDEATLVKRNYQIQISMTLKTSKSQLLHACRHIQFRRFAAADAKLAAFTLVTQYPENDNHSTPIQHQSISWQET